MERNNLIKKGVVVAVILLFIGLAFAPSINANITEIQEYQYEDCDCISESDSNDELQYKYPMRCTILFLLFLPFLLYHVMTGLESMYNDTGIPIFLHAASLNCSWVSPPEPLSNNYTEEIYTHVSGEVEGLRGIGFFTFFLEVSTHDIVEMDIEAHTLNPLEPVYHASPKNYFYAPIFIGSIHYWSTRRADIAGIAIGNIEWS